METLRGIWALLKVLGVIVLLLAAITIALAIFKQPTIAVAVGSAALMLAELLALLSAFTLGCLYAKGLMLAGAELGIRAQESDDTRDIKMIETLVSGITDIANTILRAGRNEPEIPPPMPEEQSGWLASVEKPMLTAGGVIDGNFKIN